jgi:hypothetical protein
VEALLRRSFTWKAARQALWNAVQKQDTAENAGLGGLNARSRATLTAARFRGGGRVLDSALAATMALL